MPQLKLTEELLPSLRTDKQQEEFYDSGFQQTGSFGLRVNAGGRKSFFLVYSLSGRRRRMNIGLYPSLSLAEARSRAAFFSQQAAIGRDPASEAKILGNSASFKDVVSDFDREHIETRCQPSTQLEYRRIINKELLPLWGKRVCSSIRPQDVDSLLKRIGGVKRKPTMANRVRALCSRIFAFALERGIVTENPVLRTERFSPRSSGYKALTIEESRKVWEFLSHQQDPPFIALSLILLTGQLPSRVMSMKWSDVQIDRWHVSGDPEQSIHLSPPAIDCLRKLQNPSHNYVFQTGFNRHISQLSRTSKRANGHVLIETEWTPVDLRRTVEAGLRHLGVSIDVIARILNQKSLLRRFNLNEPTLLVDSEAALRLWARTITPAKKAKPKNLDSKVIPLFPNRSD
jgi:integrase